MVWKNIKGYPNYDVSNTGEVRSWSNNGWGRSKTPKHLKKYEINSGYYIVGLWKDGTNEISLIHRLVAKAFVPNTDQKLEINHKDGNKKNNHASNLEWVTRSENHKHAFRTGLKTQRGEINSNTSLKRNDILDIRNTYRLGCFTQQEIADVYGITNGQVSNIINKKSWAHI